MAKQKRIDHFNQWPLAQKFPAEELFDNRLKCFDLQDLFFPYQIPSTTNPDIHISISYLIDAVDSLPKRPDHSFDWTWRAFEYLAGRSFPSYSSSITETLRGGLSSALTNYFATNAQASNEFYSLIKNIPFQTCEYLLKRIIDGAPYTFTSGAHKHLTSYAKRLLFANGNPPVISQNLQLILSHLSTYNFSDTERRRSGASLLRRILREQSVTIAGTSITLSRADLLFLLLSGLGYAFRNDRAHAKSIAPFRSSYASVTTYAHCWFMFLLMYEATLALLHTRSSPMQLTGCPAQNFQQNNNAYCGLFADYLNK